MIYPTRTAILTAAAGAPVALLVALVLPGRWYAALAWPVAVLLLVVIDALLGAQPGGASVAVVLPGRASVGETVDARIEVAIAGGDAPRQVQVALQTDGLLDAGAEDSVWLELRDGQGAGLMPLQAVRRGTARVGRIWLRWRGTLGLVWKQRVAATERSIAIMPDVRPVHERGAQIFQRYAIQGLMTQIDRGDGADFDALVEYSSGMDRRAIDWKQSARHVKLHAKEYRTERNNQIVFAIDSGRQMTEPVAGMSRLDRMVSAMLLTGWVALKLGDRVALHAFDSRPRIASGLVSGTAAFGELQRLAARIDYSGEATNYTHGLTALSSGLNRRSMIVLFTEFTDPISADFLVRGVRRLLRKHLLLVVVLRDEELEGIVGRRPETSDDVTRAVTAAALLRDRRTVLAHLRHLGVHVIESEHDRVAERLVQGYVDLKRRNLL